MGLLGWLAVTVHAFLWYIKWLLDGNFGNNLVALRYLMITDGNVCELHDGFKFDFHFRFTTTTSPFRSLSCRGSA